MPLSDPALLALWSQIEDSYEDLARHRAFLEAARERGGLPAAAAQYRQAARDHERRELAEQMLGQVTALAFAQLDALSAERKAARSRLGLWAVGAVLGILGVLAALLWAAFR